MATYQILYWHDIPAQVRVSEGRGRNAERASVQLPQRFQEAIDSAAMLAGLIGSDDYTNAFRWGEPHSREGTPQAVAQLVADELDVQFNEIDWRATVEKIRAR